MSEVHKLFQQRRASLIQEQRSNLSKTYEHLQKRKQSAKGYEAPRTKSGTQLPGSNIPEGMEAHDQLESRYTVSVALIGKASSMSGRGAYIKSIDKDDEHMVEFLENFVDTKKDIKNQMDHPQNETDIHRMIETATELHRIMYNYVESRTFTGFILFIIMCNSVILVATTWEVVGVRAGWYFAAMDSAFLGIYLMEIILKLFVYRKYFFREGWNILDFTIVAFNLVDFILPLIQNVGGFNGAAIFRLLKIFRAVRAMRALRVLRTIRFLSHLQVIMATCLQSIQSMGAIVGLISLFMYLFAVIGRGLYAKSDPDRFGSLASAGFTLFQLLTLDDWFYIYRDMVEKAPENWHILLYLLTYIVFEYFVFLNLFVAVLVDNFQLTLEAANQEKKKKSKKKEEEEEEEDMAYALSESSASSISVGSSEASVKIPKKLAEEYYPNLTEKERDLLVKHFQLMTSLEYNIQIMFSQQKTLDMMVDLCQETMDDEH